MEKDFRSVNVKQAETPRAELELPRLHFIVMDNWIDVIGEKAVFSWLKLFTWADRKGAKENPQLWNESRIPRSLNKIAKDLKVGKDTLYNKILKPLWNVGLIDLEEYGESDAKGNKPMNIIVYKYPQNSFDLQVKPLEFVRDYDKDYSSDAKTFAMRKSEKIKLSSKKIDGSDTEPGVVLNENHPPFSDRTIPGSEIGHNNIVNPLSNTGNFLINTQKENLNPKPIRVEKYEILYDAHIPFQLKNRIKVLIADKKLSLTSEEILQIEDAYKHQVEKRIVNPKCQADDNSAINDYEFSRSIAKMLETVNDIRNMRGSIQHWTKLAFNFKREYLLNNPDLDLTENSDSDFPFYDFIENDDKPILKSKPKELVLVGGPAPIDISDDDLPF